MIADRRQAVASQESSLPSMGKTALGMARVRAAESRRPDRLFDDPYAAAFGAAAPGAFAEDEQRATSAGLARLGAVFFFHGVIRTRFFDDYLLAATTAGCRQVVLLAAGLDTRAFRLAWPDRVRLFELDLPEVLAFKEPVLAAQHAVPRCQRVVLAADLRQDWPAVLTAAGFQPAQPTAWLVEGLLIYLYADQAARLLTAVGELSAPASQLAFEHGNIADSSLLADARAIPAMDQFTSLWKGGLGADAPDWLTRHGWQAHTHDRAALAASYGRAVPASSSGGFLTAVRRARL
jgi:methyltransferase (TIGR00027 family)